jgi:hypothetical protein
MGILNRIVWNSGRHGLSGKIVCALLSPFLPRVGPLNHSKFYWIYQLQTESLCQPCRNYVGEDGGFPSNL